MLVVADSSPLNFIVRLGHAQLLPTLFQHIIIPPEVARELSKPQTPELVRALIQKPAPWLQILAPRHLLNIPGIDPGEVEAISLADELQAALLLIDERDGRKEAMKRHIPIAGTIGVFERAAALKLVDLADVFERLKEQPDFRGKHLLDGRLATFRQKRGGP